MRTLLTSQDPDAVQAALHQGCATMATIFAMLFLSLTVGGQRANYGRYTTTIYGPRVPGIIDWYMHGTSLLAVMHCIMIDSFDPIEKPQEAFLLILFIIHYFQRSVIFAFRLDPSKVKPG